VPSARPYQSFSTIQSRRELRKIEISAVGPEKGPEYEMGRPDSSQMATSYFNVFFFLYPEYVMVWNHDKHGR
jgi:hypothetical protein